MPASTLTGRSLLKVRLHLGYGDGGSFHVSFAVDLALDHGHLVCSATVEEEHYKVLHYTGR